jgi:hypothetical protein
MGRKIFIECPFCEGSMEVDTDSGKILQKWETRDKNEEQGDKMVSALKKLEDAKKKRATLFDQTKGELEGQKKKLESTFQSEVERVKKEGVKEKPFNPFDLD